MTEKQQVRSIEQIHVRVESTTRGRLRDELSRTFASTGKEPDLVELEVCDRSGVETDLCVFLRWNRVIAPAGSALGTRLSAGLRAAGSVSHIIWHHGSPPGAEHNQGRPIWHNR